MTIFVVLLGCCFLVPIFLALHLAGTAHAAIGVYVLSLTTGLLIGTSCAAVMSKMHRRMVSGGSDIALMGAFVVEVFWVGASGVAGWWAVTLLLQRLH